MFTDWEKTMLSDIKGSISNALSIYTIPFKEDELCTLFELYEFIDKETCTKAKKKKTSMEYLTDDDKDVFMTQIIDYAVEMDKSTIKEAKDIAKLLGKLIEGEKKEK